MNQELEDLMLEYLLRKKLMQAPQKATAAKSVENRISKPRRKSKGQNVKWTMAKYEEVSSYYKLGYSPSQIARGMNLRTDQVKMAIYRMKTGSQNAPTLLKEVAV